LFFFTKKKGKGNHHSHQRNGLVHPDYHSNTQTRLLDKISTFIDFIYCELPGGLLIQAKNRKFKNKLAVPGLGKSLLSNRKRKFQGNDSKKKSTRNKRDRAAKWRFVPKRKGKGENNTSNHPLTRFDLLPPFSPPSFLRVIWGRIAGKFSELT